MSTIHSKHDPKPKQLRVWQLVLIDLLVIGLGLNLLTPPEGYPPELNGIASSLTQASGEKLSINRSQLAAEFVNQLVKAHQDSSAAEEYLRRRDPEDPSIIK